MSIFVINMFENLKILELSNVLAGPAVGMFFAELGAKVIKVENQISEGDITRKWRLPSEKKDSISAYFSSVNYNKEYLLMDYNDPIQRKSLLKLIKNSDIVITNFKDGDAEKFSLSFEDCKKINPSIIYAHIGGFASESERVAFDVILQAETGYISMTGNKNNYAKMPVALIDVLAAHQIKEGLLVALLKQKHNKQAIKVSTTLEESAIASLMNQSSNYLMANHEPLPMGTLHPNIAPYGDTVKTKDHSILILAIGTDKQFHKFCKIIDLEDNIVNEFKHNQQRLKNRTKLMQLINEKTELINSNKLLKKCKENYIPIGKIKRISEVLNSSLANEMTLEEKINNQTTKRIKTVAFKLDS